MSVGGGTTGKMKQQSSKGKGNSASQGGDRERDANLIESGPLTQRPQKGG